LSGMRPFGTSYLGRMPFVTLLACAATVMAPLMHMEVAEGDEDGCRHEEHVVVIRGGEEARQI
jgi:hypothetical protein